jgi:hypothetical protein
MISAAIAIETYADCSFAPRVTVLIALMIMTVSTNQTPIITRSVDSRALHARCRRQGRTHAREAPARKHFDAGRYNSVSAAYPRGA